jgi:collagenase-like PrtC family protease
VSSFVSVYNSFAVKFLVENYQDITRIIFPRDILINDVEKIWKNHKNLEFEIFVKNSWCYHSGHCTSHHLDYKTFLCNRER